MSNTQFNCRNSYCKFHDGNCIHPNPSITLIPRVIPGVVMTANCTSYELKSDVTIVTGRNTHRTILRRAVVKDHLDKIAELMDAQAVDGGGYKTASRDAIRKWVSSVRGAMGYAKTVVWQDIWAVVKRDYKHFFNKESLDLESDSTKPGEDT